MVKKRHVMWSKRGVLKGGFMCSKEDVLRGQKEALYGEKEALCRQKCACCVVKKRRVVRSKRGYCEVKWKRVAHW